MIGRYFYDGSIESHLFLGHSDAAILIFNCIRQEQASHLIYFRLSPFLNSQDLQIFNLEITSSYSAIAFSPRNILFKDMRKVCIKVLIFAFCMNTNLLVKSLKQKKARHWADLFIQNIYYLFNE